MLFIRSSSVYVKSTRSLLLYGFIGWSLHSSVFLARQAVARITELETTDVIVTGTPVYSFQ